MKLIFELEQNGKKYGLIKPTKTLQDESVEVNATQQSLLTSKGVLTRKMLRKKLQDSGGVFSEEDIAYNEKVYNEYESLAGQLRALISKEDKTDEDKAKEKELNTQLSLVIDQISQIETSLISLYDQTSEVIARNRTLFWYTLVLFVEEKAGKWERVFQNRDYNKLRNEYDEKTEDNEELNKILNSLGEVIAGWFFRGLSKEDLEKEWKESHPPKEEVKPEAQVEASPAPPAENA